jgi:hypothetical protein
MVAPGRAALWRATDTVGSGGGTFTGPLPSTISGLTGWWDAGSYTGIVDSNGLVLPGWNNAAHGVAGKSNSSVNLTAYHQAGVGTAPQATPRLNGVLGGVGLNTVLPPAVPNSGYLLPQMDADTGLQLASASLGQSLAWTVYLVWSRPNYLQGYGVPTSIALLTLGTTVVLGADALAGPPARLILFPGPSQTVVTTALERRHTHSIIIRNTPGVGVDVWLDDTQSVVAAPNPLPSNAAGPLLFMHSGSAGGAAQCWFHESAMWGRALTGSDITTLLAYATRWIRGARKGVQIAVMGQSNAGNALNDGAWHLLAQGIAWYLGALAYNVIGFYGGSGSAPIVGGHGISNVPFGSSDASTSWPGSFLADPGDGSDPAGWELGQDGAGVQATFAATAAEDLADVVMLLWPWTETDSIRPYSDKLFYEHAQVRLLSLTRGLLSRDAPSLPLMLWNAVPFGSGGNSGMQMVREAASDLAGAPGQCVFIGLPQTTDSNPAGGSWNAQTGAFTNLGTQTDYNHRDATDLLRFGQLAAPVAARAILAATGGDTETAIPAGLPVVGGPMISHVYQATQNSTTLIVTIVHDAGSDLIVPFQAANGQGFAVMDGGSTALPGNIISATACIRLNPTQLQITLASAPSNPQSGLLLFYPYGNANIFRGNAVTDNFASLTKPVGWDIGADLGSAWALNYPLAATTMPIAVSATP